MEIRAKSGSILSRRNLLVNVASTPLFSRLFRRFSTLLTLYSCIFRAKNFLRSHQPAGSLGPRVSGPVTGYDDTGGMPFLGAALVTAGTPVPQTRALATGMVFNCMKYRFFLGGMSFAHQSLPVPDKGVQRRESPVLR